MATVNDAPKEKVLARVSPVIAKVTSHLLDKVL